MALAVKNLLAKAEDIRDAGSMPGAGRSPRGGHGNLLQYSCLENSMQSEGCKRIGHDYSDLASVQGLKPIFALSHLSCSWLLRGKATQQNWS